jgi:hypothetical protein
VSHSLNLSPVRKRGSSFVRRGGLGKAVTELERKHLVETDRHIAECKEYIASLSPGRLNKVVPRKWRRQR